MIFTWNKYTFTWLVGLLLTVSVNAQSLLQLDKPFYVTGENLKYRLFLPEWFRNQTVTLRATLCNAQGVVLEQFVHTNRQSFASGVLHLPLDLDSDQYEFRFSALTAQKMVEPLFLPTSTITILNDLKPLPKSVEVVPEWPEKANISPLPLRVSVTCDPPLPGQRAQARLQVSVTDENGVPVSVSGAVSVIDASLCGLTQQPDQRLITTTAIQTDMTARWLTGQFKPGYINDVNDQPKQIPLLAAINLQNDQLTFTQTNEKGFFVLQMPDAEYARQIQLLDFNGGDIQIVPHETDRGVRTGKLVVTQAMLDYTALSRQQKKIAQLFPESGPVAANEPPVAPIKWKTKRNYNVTDYERFADMATFFNEVATIVRFTKDGGLWKATMYNPEKYGDFDAPPLFILDHKATYDADFIGSLLPSQIASIEVRYGADLLRKHYPAVGNGGVVILKSVSGNLPLPPSRDNDLVSVAGLTPPYHLVSPPAGNANPFITPLPCWIPDFNTDERGQATINWHTTDDKSTFLIEVVVQDKDGKRGVGRLTLR